MMKAMLCKAYGTPDVLSFEDVEEPTIEPGLVKISVHRAGVNFPDSLVIAGKYQVQPPFPFSPGMECAGIVTEIGDDVDTVKVGDRVMAEHGDGGYAEYVLAPQETTFKIPDNMTFDQAAAFPITYGTTYHALVDRAAIQPAEVLLVHGAAGGVGLNAVELGRILGAFVIATVGSDEKMDIVKEYGADYVINYKKESIRERVKALTDGNGADVIYDPVGGDIFDESIRCINWQGRLLVIGFASGRIADLKTNLALLKGCSVVGVFWGEFASRTPDLNRINFEAMLQMFQNGKLNPHICKHFSLQQANDAINFVLSRKSTGKVIIKVR